MIKHKLFALIMIVFLIFCDLGWASGEGAEHDSGFGALAWSILNFAILIFILYRFGVKKVYGYLKKRQDEIKSKLETAEKARNEAEEKAGIYREKLESIEKEIQQIIAGVKEDGEAEKKRIIESAQDASRQIKLEARKAAEEEFKRASAMLREEMVSLSVQLAEEIVRRNLTPDDQHRLVKQYLDQITELS